MYKRSKKLLVTGLTTALILSSMVIPVSATGDFSSISISAQVEEYITASTDQDPVAALVGETKVDAPASAADRVIAEKEKKETTALTKEKSEASTEAGTEEQKEEKKEEKKEEEKKEEKQEEQEKQEAKVDTIKYPQFKDRVIVTVSEGGVLNIRESADPEAEIVGTIDRAGIALVEEKGSEWSKIGSGNCEGYVKNEFIRFGDDAGAWAEENGIPKYIKVQNSGLRVRKEASTDADILDAVYENETYSVLSQQDDWVEIEMYDGTTGYVNDDYVEVRFETPWAKTVEEIEEMRRAEEEDARREQERLEAERKAAEEAERQEQEEEEAENESSESESSESESGSGSERAERSAERIERTEEIKKENENTITAEEEEEESGVSASTNSDLRTSMVEYAKQFLGNPYVWGGTSLTNGCDCSGFTMKIYEHFGYSIPRAGGQRTYGKLIKVSEAQPGDLIFYDGHVTMYIGGGKVIHSSSPSTGIIISSLSYSGTPLFGRNIIDAN